MEFDAFVVDVETMGDHRIEPFRNDVFWISLAGPGRADVIPCGHPLGERIVRDPNDDFYRIDPATGRYQEHRLNESSGRPKWVNVPDPFTEAPKQLWISDVIEELRPLFFSNRRIIGQNVKFDVLSLAKYFGAVPPGPYGDTLVAAKLINENEYQYDLGSLVKRAFEFTYEKIGKQVEIYPFSEAAAYSYFDAKYTWLLWVLYQKQLDVEGVGHIFDLEMEVTPVILDMENVGVGIDEIELQKLGDEFTLEMARLQIDLDEVWMSQGGHDTSINLNANKQIAELVYDILNKPCKEWTSGGKSGVPQRAVGKEALEAFPRSVTAKKILDYKKLSKLQGTFIEGLQNKLFDGRVHPSFNQAPTGDRGQGSGGTVSGRLSCVSADTLIEMPRDLRKYPGGVPITQVAVGDWVYCFDWTRELQLRQVTWVGETGIRETVVVTVENSEGHQLKLRLTPEHLVRLRNGDWRPAGSLHHRWGDAHRSDGPRVMTMVRRGIDAGYVKFWPHSVNRGWGSTVGKVREHRWVVEQITGKRVSTKTDVHHIDGSGLNNHPDNLEKLTVAEHRGWRDLHPHWGKGLQELPHEVYSGPTDYVVVGVEEGIIEPVWDIEVEGVHNFIANGICVHNCSSPNIQQIPSRSERGKRVRDVFVSGPDNVLIVADLSQIELRVLAHFTQDKTLMRAYKRGDDLHSILAAQVFGEDFTPEERGLAKNGNFCVPMNTEALTREGWKTVDSIGLHDQVLGYDNGALRWTDIQAVHTFDSAPLVEMSNNHFRAVSTPNHRWVGERRRQKGYRGPKVWEREKITTEEIGAEHRLHLSAPLDAIGMIPVIPNEAALIAWLWTDGSIVRGTFSGGPSQAGGKRVAFQGRIYQSKPEGVTVIDSLMKSLGISFRHTIRKPINGRAPIQVWTIDPDYLRDLWLKAGLDDVSPVAFVASLGSEAVQAFANAAWQAEGWVDRRGAKIMAQNNGPVYEAMALATFLTGHHPQVSTNGTYKGTENLNIRFGKPYVNGTRITKTSMGSAPVWCLTTDLGSWVMRQGHQIMLTGNSVLYGAQASTLVRRYGFPDVKLAKQVRDGFYTAYPRVEPWKTEIIETAISKFSKAKHQQCYVETILGRKRRLPALRYVDMDKRGAAERQAISVTISGSAADLFKVIMIDCQRLLTEQSWEGHILMTVHDELVVEVPEAHAEEGLRLVKSAMEDVFNPFTGQPMLSVPIVADAKIVTRWSDGK